MHHTAQLFSLRCIEHSIDCISSDWQWFQYYYFQMCSEYRMNIVNHSVNHFHRQDDICFESRFKQECDGLSTNKTKCFIKRGVVVLLHWKSNHENRYCHCHSQRHMANFPLTNRTKIHAKMKHKTNTTMWMVSRVKHLNWNYELQ